MTREFGQRMPPIEPLQRTKPVSPSLLGCCDIPGCTDRGAVVAMAYADDGTCYEDCRRCVRHYLESPAANVKMCASSEPRPAIIGPHSHFNGGYYEPCGLNADCPTPSCHPLDHEGIEKYARELHVRASAQWPFDHHVLPSYECDHQFGPLGRGAAPGGYFTCYEDCPKCAQMASA